MSNSKNTNNSNDSKSLHSNSNNLKRFTVCLLERNAKGIITGRKKEFSSDNAYKIWEFYNRNAGHSHIKGGKRKTSSAGKSSEKDVQKWSKEASGYKDKDDK